MDEQNVVNEVEVDMRDFKLHVDNEVEFMGCNNQIPTDNVDNEVGGQSSLVVLEVLNNDLFESASDSEDGIDKIRRTKINEYQKDCNSANVDNKTHFYVTQRFESSNEAKEMIRLHSVETRRNLKIIKNDKVRIRVMCVGTIPNFTTNEIGEPSGPISQVDEMGPNENQVDKGKKVILQENICPWILHISNIRKTETWMVKTFNGNHKCLQSRQVKACTAEFLSKQIVDQIESNPEIPVRVVQDQLQKKFELGISKMKPYRAKSKAVIQVKGD